LIFVCFSKICGEISSFIPIWRIPRTLHAALCTFKIVYRWILLRMRNFWNKSCTENQNTVCFRYPFFFFRKSCRLRDNVEKYGRARQAHVLYVLDN